MNCFRNIHLECKLFFTEKLFCGMLAFSTSSFTTDNSAELTPPLADARIGFAIFAVVDNDDELPAFWK